jgi:hypothetical protein
LSRLASQQVGSRRVAIARPKNDVFVVLLAISVAAGIIACVLLAMEMSAYEWSTTPKGVWLQTPGTAIPASQLARNSIPENLRDGLTVPGNLAV